VSRGNKLSALYLVRHAHAEWTSDENRPLSDQGSRDAVRVAKILCGHPIGVIYSSPFRRARDTIAPLAERLGLLIHLETDLQERKLGNGDFKDFFKAVETTWRNPAFAHPGGESSITAQQRGIAVVERLLKRHRKGNIVLSTHGNLMALILQIFDPSVDFIFWKSLTMPDVYKLNIDQSGKGVMQRLWQEVGA
jgi:2,3-bisphosphoglycerate-dependent phosphoglycerate mutase